MLLFAIRSSGAFALLLLLLLLLFDYGILLIDNFLFTNRMLYHSHCNDNSKNYSTTAIKLIRQFTLLLQSDISHTIACEDVT